MDVFILLVIRPGLENEVYEKLKNRPEVKEIYKVYGDYDIVLRLSIDGIKALDKFHDEVLRKLPGIELSETLIASSY
ncbi:Lrp/AsnC ligand binding domain-containing protein [Pyrococcus abyssi]|uniref:AsnC family transcriptional regulator n=1 Tax=Pyrococcus abyssi (strain GE5 / Orsay) TaxID=272844 RepID=Q9V1E7_PYRAB|nr:Lrp/AsnC ligand binding domain-containing protein [Pyrococcus abyssi]CAB49402.1 Transcriptional regulatory protein, asnC family [Pyrococcus abyssi GE5]CCE69863.1 TPA: AsnC family transcriptional regulator [Pyrococcus abyssi GE5]